MPQRTQPTSLYTMCIDQAQVMVKTASTNIGKKFGDYGNQQTMLAIAEVQQYLLSVVDGFYLDMIFNTYHGKLLHSLEYTAIYFSIFLHANMKHMTIPTHFKTWKPYEEETKDKLKVFVADFWKAHLPQLTKLERLNLCRFCNDSVLEVVGQYCLKLEIIELDFDASAQGMEFLVNCKDLKEINTSHVGRTRTFMSAEVGSLLLRSLPKLEKVFCCFLGTAIVSMDEMTSLRLRSVTEVEATPEHIHAIARLCPNVKELKLTNYGEDTGCPEVLTALAESDIKVSVLELFKFSFGPEMISLLSHKGIFLTKLHVNQGVDSMSLSFSDIKFIGDTCPNLKSLDLRAYDITNDCGVDVDVTDSTNPVFTQLVSLAVTGFKWDYAVLEIILTHALNINNLLLHSEEFSHPFAMDENGEFLDVWNELTTPLDLVFAKLLLSNPLKEIESVSISAGAEITMPTLDKLVVGCPKFRFFVAGGYCSFYDNPEFKKLHKRVKEQNLHLTFPVADVYLMDVDSANKTGVSGTVATAPDKPDTLSRIQNYFQNRGSKLLRVLGLIFLPILKSV